MNSKYVKINNDCYYVKINNRHYYYKDTNLKILHKNDGPAYIVYLKNETIKYWFKNGALHRIGGPAVIKKSYHAWYLNGKLHRDDGPAEEFRNEIAYYKNLFWVNGIICKNKCHWKELKKIYLISNLIE